MATAAAGLAPAKEVVEKKVELLKEIRAHEVAIAELDNLNPSRVSLFPSVSLPCLRFVSGAARWYWYQITNGYH
ncbi:Prefoldin chaperone subunit family protein [Zea mays]|uniref:Prefoldin chaperone subunit family protein n=1 Tax=Zea mays TaxID=4577 RepID=A0A1D6HYT3_MAIZE|nr:Prefoldin chaperone subunit family protein [Zea mays]ONM53276.1 Prefoldin chaperone subunit family protein [Zea mays]